MRVLDILHWRSAVTSIVTNHNKSGKPGGGTCSVWLWLFMAAVDFGRSESVLFLGYPGLHTAQRNIMMSSSLYCPVGSSLSHNEVTSDYLSVQNCLGHFYCTTCFYIYNLRAIFNQFLIVLRADHKSMQFMVHIIV